ncbi:hypothetical protein PM082_017766 [Marasmius tenuissimus]|nr:hypothetical protein PM082_017766 [Marasmius tenuissimus]
MTAPNGTMIMDSTLGSLQDCRLYPGTRGAGFAAVHQEGTYTGRWNITYAIANSPDLCTRDESVSLSLQNFTLEHSFEVHLSGEATGSPAQARSLETTITRSLGSQPTGEVSLNSGPASIGKTELVPILLVVRIVMGML